MAYYQFNYQTKNGNVGQINDINKVESLRKQRRLYCVSACKFDDDGKPLKLYSNLDVKRSIAEQLA